MDLTTLLNFVGAFKNTASSTKSATDDVAGAVAGMLTSNNKSIRYRSKSLVAQYPVLYSDNISPRTVSIVNKALEVEYVQLLRLLILNDRVSTDFKGTSDYLGGFHQNIHNDQNMDGVLNKIANESVDERSLNETNKALLATISEDLDLESLNKLSVDKSIIGKLNESTNTDTEVITEAEVTPSGNKLRIDKVDIHKINELTPTNVSVDINIVQDEQRVDRTISFGVKCVAHLLKSDDIEKYLPTSVITKTPIMRMIQWTTGEIKFFKDLILAVDNARDMAVKGNRGDTFWWKKLQDLATVSKMNPFLKKLSFGKNATAPIPTATMVITKENVDAIKYKHGVDILAKPSFAYKIMRNFFLMTFIVVDESTETLYMYNEDTKNFSTYSFSSLEGATKQKNVDMGEVYRSIFK